jgi:hypothetical protein
MKIPVLDEKGNVIGEATINDDGTTADIVLTNASEEVMRRVRGEDGLRLAYVTRPK